MSSSDDPTDLPGEDSAVIEPHALAVDTGGGQLARRDDPEEAEEPPLVTAVVTTYDRFEEATVAIESVLEQTYRPLEVIVVEDGTESGVEAWIASEGHEHVRYVRHADNEGLPGARNTALALATGDYVAFLDDDDRWKPTRIERGIELLRDRSATDDPTYGVTYCAAESRKGGRPATIIHPENDGDLAASIREVGPSTVESACIFSRAALLEVGGYDESLRSSVDHDVWMALAAGGYAAIAQDEPLVVTSIDFAGTMTTDTDDRIAGVRQFVEKWRPMYYEWLGESEGERRVQRYFAGTIARLAAVKFVGGRFGEARRAVGAIFRESDQWGYNLAVLSLSVAEFGAKRVFPPAGLRLLSRIVG